MNQINPLRKELVFVATFIFLFGLFLSSPTKTNAQYGTFTCGPPAGVGCQYRTENCTGNNVPYENACNLTAECNGTFDCVTPTPTMAAPVVGTDQYSCGSWGWIACDGPPAPVNNCNGTTLVQPREACTTQAECYGVFDCVTPTPTPIPASDCYNLTCSTAQAGNECDDFGDPCVEQTLATGACRCIAKPESLDCNQICKADSECQSICGECRRENPLSVVEPARCLAPRPTSPTSSAPIEPYDPCIGVDDANYDNCKACVASGGSWTALGTNGCLLVQPTKFAGSVIGILFGLAGGVAFLLMIYGAFLCIVSRGDPQKAQACKETITAAVVGLLMLIFSLFIVRWVFGPLGVIPGLVDIF